MNRDEALELWQRIANGDLRRPQYDPIDLTQWIEGIAANVLKADALSTPDGKPDSKQRTDALADAIGLGGKKESYPRLRRSLKVVEEFDSLDDDVDGQKDGTAGQQGSEQEESPREAIFRVAKDLHPELRELPKDAALKRVDRVVQEVRHDRKPNERRGTDAVLRNLPSGKKT